MLRFVELPTTVDDLDRILTRQAVNRGEGRCCCVCQKYVPCVNEGYHPLGSILPFCSRACRIKARDAAVGLQLAQTICGVELEYVR